MARAACALLLLPYPWLNALPWLRTHRLAWIGELVFQAFAARAGVVATNGQVDALLDVERIRIPGGAGSVIITSLHSMP